jgi:hypothetical protein
MTSEGEEDRAAPEHAREEPGGRALGRLGGKKGGSGGAARLP